MANNETNAVESNGCSLYENVIRYCETALNRYFNQAREQADAVVDGAESAAVNSEDALALLELSTLVGGEEARRYRSCAEKVVNSPAASAELLARYREIQNEEAELAEIVSRLPTAASVPDDTFDNIANALLAVKIRGIKTESAEAYLTTPVPDTPDELYFEFLENGNRINYERPFFARVAMLDTLIFAEREEGQGRFISKIRDVITAICDMKSWTLPAHDKSDGGRGTFRGTFITTDLFSSEVAVHILAAVSFLGPKLGEDLVKRIKGEVERRVFAPVRRDQRYAFIPKSERSETIRVAMWWLNGHNNWNSVCWDNVVTAALGFIDDPIDRARFVQSAIKAIPMYIENGFNADGYCNEGAGYWNYGFGHHLHMGILLRNVSGGKLDIFTNERQRLAAVYGCSIPIVNAAPPFADCVFGSGDTINPLFIEQCRNIWPDIGSELPPFTEFADYQLWVLRSSEISAAFEGGNNGANHNHNDLGSYAVVLGDKYVSGDCGSEVYTRFTFSAQRYDSKINNSYGHPVPVVGGHLQSLGADFRAVVLEKNLTGDKPYVTLELKGGYECETLKSLKRTFTLDREAHQFIVEDTVEFTEPTEFEDVYLTYLKSENEWLVEKGLESRISWDVRPQITVEGAGYSLKEESIPNPGRLAPHRVGIKLDGKVSSAKVRFVFG